MELSIDKGDSLSVIIAIGLLAFAFGIPFTAFSLIGAVITMIVGAFVAVMGIALQNEE
jgi:hydrogenase/urease accessory protein HupE